MEILAWFGKLDVDEGSFTPFKSDDKVDFLESSSCLQAQPDLRALAKAYGFAGSDAEYNERLREFAINLVRRQLRELTTAEKDLLQAVEALDDLNQSVNLLDERLYEWSRLHRDEIVHGKDLAEALKSDKTLGDMARAILGLRESRLGLENEVAEAAANIAPNLSSLAGPILAARLISRAGGLKHLSEMPSSAIQVMGAEKSLFKHLKGNAPSPKHGLIFRHPSISGAPKRLRGRIARALAGKLAIAARLDSYGAGPSAGLKESLDRRLAEIRKRGRTGTAKS
ncbi:MAG: NOP5/NOP56 family protein [Methanotrichaceae archaeon]